jgi:hypothetical protein
MAEQPQLDQKQRQTYQALLDVVPPDAPRHDEYAILQWYPVPAIAENMGYQPSTIRKKLNDLGSELYCRVGRGKSIADGGSAFWRVKLFEPTEEPPPVQNGGGNEGEVPAAETEAAEVDVQGIANFNTLLRRAAGEIVDLRERVSFLEGQLDSSKADNVRLTTENIQLREQLQEKNRQIALVESHLALLEIPDTLLDLLEDPDSNDQSGEN